MLLAAHELTFSYPGVSRSALDCVSLEVAHGTTLAVVGPSGAGKTTLLRAIAGLVRVRSGDVLLDGRSIYNEPPQRRRIALVAQDDALFANMSVRENLRFALRGARRDGHSVVETATALHVGDYLDRRPRQLSGGERQRASIARALLSDPVALLLDEPLAHLDPSLRRSVRDEVIGVRERFEGPILYVTHDHVEAMSVGDVLAVLIDGRIEDVGEPQRVYDSPRTLTVARFLGERPMNLFESGGAIVGIRPERIRLAAGAAVSGRVARRESTGADAYLEVETQHGLLAVRVPASAQASSGDRVGLDLPADALRRFDALTGVAIA
ncbi:MAG TPA: ABC transporter ATP-binding protein [Candidatus Babeliales bacterium]|nr:ABC transporter ATP-binding protein [Candidatus Babeliales bacterium]